MLGLRERCKNMQTFLIWETNCHKEHERKISIKNIKAQHCPSKGNTGDWKYSFACEYGQCFLTLRKTVISIFQPQQHALTLKGFMTLQWSWFSLGFVLPTPTSIFSPGWGWSQGMGTPAAVPTPGDGAWRPSLILVHPLPLAPGLSKDLLCLQFSVLINCDVSLSPAQKKTSNSIRLNHFAGKRWLNISHCIWFSLIEWNSPTSVIYEKELLRGES